MKLDKKSQELIELSSEIEFTILNLDGEPEGTKVTLFLTKDGWPTLTIETSQMKQYLTQPFFDDGQSVIEYCQSVTSGLQLGDVVDELLYEIVAHVYESAGPWAEHSVRAGTVRSSEFGKFDLDNVIVEQNSGKFTDDKILNAYAENAWL